MTVKHQEQVGFEAFGEFTYRQIYFVSNLKVTPVGAIFDEITR